MKRRLLALLICSWSLSGCVVGYLTKSSYNQMKLLMSRTPIDEVLEDPKVDEATKKKLRLAKEAKEFAEKELGLTPTNNYGTFVDLGRPYVSWIVRAAPVYKLEAYLWTFPIVGSIPYKGYFNKEDALEEAKDFDPNKYDTYVRGVGAYSTLGWFDDPILSSMTTMRESDFVNVIIHETVHATIYIKSQADFNERLATFLGDLGAEMFYFKREGEGSPTVKQTRLENADGKLFSKFITQELKELRAWYSLADKKVLKSPASINTSTKVSGPPELDSASWYLGTAEQKEILKSNALPICKSPIFIF